MKKIYSFLSILLTSLLFAQTTIYSENFGNPTTTTLLTAYSGYQNSSPIVYSGTADVRTSNPSEGYTGASGSGSVFFGNVTSASGNPAKTLMIEGIDTSNYTSIALTFGHYKGTNDASNQLTIEVSPNGSSWSMLSYTRPTGTGTSNWVLISPAGTIPATANLRIRITNVLDSNAGFRVDDIKLTGIAASLAIRENSKKEFNIYPTSITAGKIFITSAKNADKKVKIFDQTGRLMINKTIKSEINVSNLSKGIYILNVEESGTSLSQKIIIR
ncbi:T9SS type A sorting domain-containing protein [Chryseobacterium sp. Ch-15]|uniref:T9SS type A sorting domain-containing protein n=1 Tax=Chryseobacterium muglaense TaxID=2893752 RepID=A0A9Q3UTG4_9FLAO|nr:T9SS type A sorting domain-containing protein [Chryseobacterium muglaense]MBD3904330.1 T9SS type A sorting domain-containing protein [Chryseobacterium muglaense]MCC9035353.1 T9SS type A sorting domain-containing protein [Chryseobacterium muglaense]MCM2553982.1 T9SS type A sorting domain-containing protein [Chryseobacterium muglaense]